MLTLEYTAAALEAMSRNADAVLPLAGGMSADVAASEERGAADAQGSSVLSHKLLKKSEKSARRLKKLEPSKS